MPQHPGHPSCHANGDEGRIVGTEQAGATRPREKHRWGAQEKAGDGMRGPPTQGRYLLTPTNGDRIPNKDATAAPARAVPAGPGMEVGVRQLRGPCWGP